MESYKGTKGSELQVQGVLAKGKGQICTVILFSPKSSTQIWLKKLIHNSTKTVISLFLYLITGS